MQHIAIGQPVPGTIDSTDHRTVSLTVSIGIETPAISVISLISYGEKDPKITGKDASGAEYEINYRDIEGFVLTATDTARYFGQ